SFVSSSLLFVSLSVFCFSYLPPLPLSLLFFFFSCYRALLALHSFPTRRSSDLCFFFDPLPFITNTNKYGITCIFCHFNRDFSSKDRKSTRLNSSHVSISYAVFCLKKKI